MFTEKALTAESLHVYRHPVTGLYRGHSAAHFLNNAHHLVAHGNAGNCTGNAAMLNVQVTGADATQRNPDNGIPWILQCGSGLLSQFKFSLFDVCIGKHGLTSILPSILSLI
jgi:hypothetical protein